MQNKNALAVVQQTLKSQETINQLILAGSLTNDETGINQANKYIASIMGEIERTEGSEKPLSQCDIGSIRQTLIDSMRFKVPIDGRKMAHIDVRWNKSKSCNEAILQIDTNGFVAKIAEHYPDFHITATPVFQGDDLEILDGGTVKHKQKNPLCSDLTKLEGMIVKCSYTKGGRFIQDAIPVTKQDLFAMKAASKAQNVWNTWAIERMKTAAIKRICKWNFRQIQGVQDIIDHDNKQNYEVAAVDVKTVNVIDNINSILGEPTITENKDVIEGEFVEDNEIPIFDDTLLADGDLASEMGTEAFKGWFTALGDKVKLDFETSGQKRSWWNNARRADIKLNEDEELPL